MEKDEQIIAEQLQYIAENLKGNISQKAKADRKEQQTTREEMVETFEFKFDMPQYDELVKMIDERRDQEAKADYGKEKLTLVPRRIIHDICAIRMYGNEK